MLSSRIRKRQRNNAVVNRDLCIIMVKESKDLKRFLSWLLVAVLLCFTASGCSDYSGSKMIAEAQNSNVSQELSIELMQSNYGVPAYEMLEYIQHNYPGRIAGTEKEKEMAVFIISILLNGGYSEKDISVQPFNITDSSPAMVAEETNEFDGGEKSNSSQNIEVVIKGESEKTIVVGAHYDSVGTHGVDDNGSGVTVVLENALRMANTQPYYTIRYVFFGSEEIGMCGSRAYVERLSQKEKENIILMINIDSVLAGDYLYLYGGHISEDGDVDRTEAVIKTAELANETGIEIQLPPEGNVDYPYPTGQKRSDHAPFNDIEIPYVYFEANNWEKGYPDETQKYGLVMHTGRDDLEFIENEYGKRGQNTLTSYSLLLYSMLQETDWEQPN